jgi:DNA-directed RNA polymerase specialized sigma24 family protein
VLEAALPDGDGGRESFAQLYLDYWPPLYAYVRRRGFSPAEAEDLTQDFFTRILEKRSLSGLRREGGRFRSFLLGAMANFLAGEWDRGQTQKRGSGRKPLSLDAEDGEVRFQALAIAGELTPESVFEKQWAKTLLERVGDLLRGEELKSGKGNLFEGLRPHLQSGRAGLSYAEIATRHGMSGGAIKVAVHRLRHRFGQRVREEIARTVSSPSRAGRETPHHEQLDGSSVHARSAVEPTREGRSPGAPCLGTAPQHPRRGPSSDRGLRLPTGLDLCHATAARPGQAAHGTGPQSQPAPAPGEECVFGWASERLGVGVPRTRRCRPADILCDLGWQVIRRNPAITPVGNAQTHANLGAVRLAQQKYAAATTLLREGLRLTEKHDLDTGYRLYVMSLLGASLVGQKNYADAEPLLLESCEGLQQRQASLPPYLNAPRLITESLERLVQLYDAWGKPTEAAEWKQKLAAFRQANKVSDSKSKTP